MTRWLTILGIGEDGIEGLSPAARTLLQSAPLVIGGARHLALAQSLISGASQAWSHPIEASFPDIFARRGTQVVVLASGDPYCFGIGATLARMVSPAEILCLPAPSAFSLACARLGWAQAEVDTLSFCGRPLEAIFPLLQPGRRLLALSADAATPAAVTELLTLRGFGASRIHLLEALGGPSERHRMVLAQDGAPHDILPLNLLGIELVAHADATIISLASGLPDSLFEHDGQITKQEIRAVTLASLAPRAGDLLWDIGCGSGSVAIEFLLRHSANQAIGIDHHHERLARAAGNAANLGVPRLRLIAGHAQTALAGLPAPDAIFIGGGGDAAVIETCWAALKPAGRIVINAVTIETEALLIETCLRLGGTLTRLSVERLDRIGTKHGFRPAMTITQWTATK